MWPAYQGLRITFHKGTLIVVTPFNLMWQFYERPPRHSVLCLTRHNVRRVRLIAWVIKCQDSFPQLFQVSDRNINGNTSPSLLCRLNSFLPFFILILVKRKNFCNVVSGRVWNSYRFLLEWRYVSEGLQLESVGWEDNSRGRWDAGLEMLVL